MLLAAGAIMIVATTPAFGDHVEPVFVASNPNCASIESTWDELKVEPVSDGTYSDGTLTVTVDVDGSVFDWSSDIGVDAVLVKGGPDANLYRYDPPAEETADTGLHAPTNPANDQFYGLSHISFCYDTAGGPSPSPSPSPTEIETSSPSPSPTILGTQTERPPTTSPTSTVAGERLARTGPGTGALALAGAIAVLMGLGMLGASMVIARPPRRA